MNRVFDPSDKYYQTGGSLNHNARSYVIRQADDELIKNLEAREYCYIFNARQMGKSSLRVRAMNQLKDKGFSCAVIDMTEICTHKVSQEDFYSTIISQLVADFKINIQEEEWWNKKRTNFMFRLIDFIEEFLLENVNQNIIIFVEEIDRIIKVEFKDEFFNFLRTCYNKRDNNDKYKRLTFALLGVATPFDLIADNITTAFNFGQEIELTGFKIDETEPLQDGFKELQEKISDPKAVLEEVLFWTGGQPYLTQKVCQIILSKYSGIQNNQENTTIKQGKEKEIIEQLVQDNVIKNWMKNDSQKNLLTINDRLKNSPNCKQLLIIYKQILEEKEIKLDKNNRIHMEILLSGLVVEIDRKLKVYNRIYESIFNQSWIDDTERENISSSSEQNNSELETEVEKLYEGLKAGDFCYVLSSQVTDKNKFLKKINSYLEAKNTQVVIINSDKIYEESNRRQFDWKAPEARRQWYFSVATIIYKKFSLSHQIRNINDWWRDNKDLGTDQNQGQKLLIKYIETEILKIQKEYNIIIIFDLISFDENDKVYYHLFDIINEFDFKNEIFNLFCSCYERRRQNSNFEKLTFFLLDVIIDSEYIRPDINNITIGCRINLGNALEQQAKSIINHGLNKIMLDRILYWTSGQPFFTQKLLKMVLDDVTFAQPKDYTNYIDNLVDRQIITPFKSTQKSINN
ncbi:MAG: AAA-like domain-containing protein [Nostoc sp. DedQUE11]|nr:AAA-like domain-containing protein [Nostoc sp. DedQUE11]